MTDPGYTELETVVARLSAHTAGLPSALGARRSQLRRVFLGLAGAGAACCGARRWLANGGINSSPKRGMRNGTPPNSWKVLMVWWRRGRLRLCGARQACARLRGQRTTTRVLLFKKPDRLLFRQKAAEIQQENGGKQEGVRRRVRDRHFYDPPAPLISAKIGAK